MICTMPRGTAPPIHHSAHHSNRVPITYPDKLGGGPTNAIEVVEEACFE